MSWADQYARSKPQTPGEVQKYLDERGGTWLRPITIHRGGNGTAYIDLGERLVEGQTIPGQEDEPLRPENRSVAVSTYGKTISLSIGKRRLGGNIIWATELVPRRIGDYTYVQTIELETDHGAVEVIGGGSSGGDDDDDGSGCQCGGSFPNCAQCDKGEPCCDDDGGSGGEGDPVPPGSPPDQCVPGTQCLKQSNPPYYRCCKLVKRTCNGVNASDEILYESTPGFGCP